MTVLDEVLTLCDLASELTSGSALAVEIPPLRQRLSGPLRVAIAGRVKAGKSTLLNALVGERLAATDAGECTRVVTWYREGIAYEVKAVLRSGAEHPLRFARSDGTLVIELGDIELNGSALDDVERIEVACPSSALHLVTLIDTPGLASLNDDNSVRTRDFLAFDSDRSSDADAVIYLMRHLHRRDAEFLGSFMDRSVSASSPVNAVAVLSRADEIGACRLDALDSAMRIAARYRADTQLRELCTAIVPVAGLLAETGLSLREDEAATLRTLSATPADELALMLLAVDEFCAPERSNVTVELRRQLLDRLGLFGVRLLIDAIQSGRVQTAADMARELVDRSGLAALRSLLTDHLLPRSQVLKARSTITGLRSIATRLATIDEVAGRRLASEIERVEISTPEFAQLRLSHLVLSGEVNFDQTEIAELARLTGDGSVAERLGAVDGASFNAVAAALAAVERWRLRGSDPMSDAATNEACNTMARAYESLYVEALGPPH